MCGRFTITHPNEALAALFQAAPGNDLPQGPIYNLCPTNPVAIITLDAPHRRLRAMLWGFLPAWFKTPADGPLIITGRAEIIATIPAFCEAVRAAASCPHRAFTNGARAPITPACHGISSGPTPPQWPWSPSGTAGKISTLSPSSQPPLALAWRAYITATW